GACAATRLSGRRARVSCTVRHEEAWHGAEMAPETASAEILAGSARVSSEEGFRRAGRRVAEGPAAPVGLGPLEQGASTAGRSLRCCQDQRDLGRISRRTAQVAHASLERADVPGLARIPWAGSSPA